MSTIAPEPVAPAPARWAERSVSVTTGGTERRVSLSGAWGARMELTAEMSRRIEERIAAFISSEEGHPDVRNIAARLPEERVLRSGRQRHPELADVLEAALRR